MKLLYTVNDKTDEIQTDSKRRIDEILDDIISRSRMPEIVVTSGAASAMLPIEMRLGKYSELFRKVRIVHEIEPGEDEVFLPFDDLACDYYCEELNGIRYKDSIYPTACALIYCDRIIIKDRSIYSNCGPVIPHYIRQFGFKIFEFPQLDSSNEMSICRELFRYR